MRDADHAIVIGPELHERLVTAVRNRFPVKSFGYLVSDAGPYEPTDVLFFDGNIRNDRFWKPTFEAYGRYFVDHGDAGFVATPEESWAIQQEMLRRGVVEVGVFHSHQRHPANFSRIDYEMHCQRFASLWHLIISFRNISYPRLRAFDVSDSGVHELPLRIPSGAMRWDS